MTSHTIQRRAEKILREMEAACNCGGPQYGTDHAPDCSLEHARDDAWEEAQQQTWEESEADR
jgi:hypothetical protein